MARSLSVSKLLNYLNEKCSLFTILDNEPPMINSCPDDVIIPVVPSSNQVLRSWIPPTISDNSGHANVSLSCSATTSKECKQTGSGLFLVGVTEVIYSATDTSGNNNTCGFTITVTGLPCYVDSFIVPPFPWLGNKFCEFDRIIQ